MQRVGRYAAVALGASIPVSPALDGVLFLVLLVAWAACGDFRGRLAALGSHPAALAALGFLAVLAAGLAWGPGSVRDGWYYLAKHLELVLLAVLAGLALREADKRRALLAYLAAMAVTLALSYAIAAGILPVEESLNRSRQNPTVFKLHITQGVFMAFAAFLAAVEATRTTDKRWRAVLILGALLAAHNVLFMLQGRTGYLVLGALTVYFFIARWRWRGAAVAALAVAGTFATAYLAEAPLFPRIEASRTELAEWREGRGDTSTGLRMDYYRTSLEIIRQHPLVGVGTGGFVHAYREQVAGSGRPESNNPHNQYLLVGVQLGLLGVAALLALFGTLWWQAGRLSAPERMALRGLVLVIAGGSLLNSFLLDHAEGMLFAWMAGMLLAPAPGADRYPAGGT